ncbi:MAG: IS66 family transposase, partial [Actinomycetes bacterium]
GPGRRRRGQQPGSPGHGRRDYSHLPTEEQVHDIPEPERVCPRCGAGYERFGEERGEQVDWQVRLVRIVHRRPTYRRTCRCPVPGVIAAPPPARPVAKGRWSAGFLARLLVEKYVLGRPLHRVVAALGYDGLQVAEGSLVGTLRQVSGLLGPLETAIRDRNAAAAHQHIDETSWKVFQSVAGKANHRWWLWVFLARDTTVFRIERSRSTAVLREHFGLSEDLTALPDGRRLLISADFWTAYQCLSTLDGVDPLWCWAHIRRYFLRAGQGCPELAGWATEWVTDRIGALYLAHTALAAAEPGTQAHTRAGQAYDAAIADIDTARREQSADPDLPERARKVLATLDHEW